MEGMHHGLISQTQGAPHIKHSFKDNGSIISGGNSIQCSMNGDNNTMDNTNMHQSFINLIYPSKTKKMINNNKGTTGGMVNVGKEYA